MICLEDAAWSAEIADAAGRKLRQWDIEGLPSQLRRNSLDYYYLSVWPGLAALDLAADITLPPRPARTEYAYVHIPFCSGLCNFCSYFLTVSRDAGADPRVRRYLSELIAQTSIHQRDTDLRLSYIYFGGGTPSLLHPDQLEHLLAGFAGLGILSPQLIGTMELHPEAFGDSSRMNALLDVLDAYGIKRVSLGFQTDDTEILRATNRRHGAEFLAEAVGRLRSRKITINIDLMYGLPGQTLESWLQSIGIVLALRPDSISTYFTFIDRGTSLWRQVKRKPALLTSHAQAQLQHIAAQLALEGAGYAELPNDFYSIPADDPACYVQETLPSDANTLALGAGAYGYYPGVQYFNQFNFERYSEMVRNREIPIWRAAALTPQEELCRDIMFSLKNSPALNVRLFEAKHGVSPADAHAATFAQLTDLELVRVRPEEIRLSTKGRLVVEEIACMFAPPRRGVAGPASRQEAALVQKHNFVPTYSIARAGGKHGGSGIKAGARPGGGTA